MKKTKRIKSRHGKLLFDNNSPFKHKVVPDKTKYNRKKNPRTDGDFLLVFPNLSEPSNLTLIE